jgi:hypothetical protein
MRITKHLGTIVSLSLICTFFSNKLKAQDTQKTESGQVYELTSNEPAEVPALNLNITLLTGNISVASPGILGGGVGGSYRITQNISAIASAMIQYTFAKFSPDITDGRSAILNPWHHLELGGIYFVTNKKINGKYNVVIGAGRNGSSTPSYLNVKGDFLRKFGIRAGYYNDNQIVSGTHATFTGYNVDDPLRTRYNLTGKFSLNMQTSVIFGGVDLETVRDIAIKYANENFGESRNMDFYFDVLFAPSIKYDDIFLINSIGGADRGIYNLDDYSTKSNTGVRLGFKYAPFNSFNTSVFSWRLYYNLETGIMPGPVKNMFYLSGGLGASFGI